VKHFGQPIFQSGMHEFASARNPYEEDQQRNQFRQAVGMDSDKTARLGSRKIPLCFRSHRALATLSNSEPEMFESRQNLRNQHDLFWDEGELKIV
jgi:hypothetical protein